MKCLEWTPSHNPASFARTLGQGNFQTGGAPGTLDSGQQSFRGPLSKVLLIPALRPTHLGCAPVLRSHQCDVQLLLRWLLLLLLLLLLPLLPLLLLCDRLSVHLAAASCFGLHQITIPRSKLTQHRLLSGSSGIAIVSRGRGMQASSVTCHVISWAWRGIAWRRCCQSTVPPECAGLYGTVSTV